MRYIGKVYRPPSEADAYLLQATIGSHNSPDIQTNRGRNRSIESKTLKMC